MKINRSLCLLIFTCILHAISMDNVFCSTELTMLIYDHSGKGPFKIDSFQVKNLQTDEFFNKSGYQTTFQTLSGIDNSDMEEFSIQVKSNSKIIIIQNNQSEDISALVQIFNINGVCLYDYPKKFNSSSETIIDVNNFPIGTYLISIENEKTKFSKLFLIVNTENEISSNPELKRNIENYQIIAYKRGSLPDTLLYQFDDTKSKDTIYFNMRFNKKWENYGIQIFFSKIHVQKYYESSTYDISKGTSKYTNTDTIFFDIDFLFNENYVKYHQNGESYYELLSFLEPNIISFQLFNSPVGSNKSIFSCSIDIDEANMLFNSIVIRKLVYNEDFGYPYESTDKEIINIDIANIVYQKANDEYYAVIKGEEISDKLLDFYLFEYSYSATYSHHYVVQNTETIEKILNSNDDSIIEIFIRKIN